MFIFLSTEGGYLNLTQVTNTTLLGWYAYYVSSDLHHTFMLIVSQDKHDQINYDWHNQNSYENWTAITQSIVLCFSQRVQELYISCPFRSLAYIQAVSILSLMVSSFSLLILVHIPDSPFLLLFLSMALCFCLRDFLTLARTIDGSMIVECDVFEPMLAVSMWLLMCATSSLYGFKSLFPSDSSSSSLSPLIPSVNPSGAFGRGTDVAASSSVVSSSGKVDGSLSDKLFPFPDPQAATSWLVWSAVSSSFRQKSISSSSSTFSS